MRRKWYVKPAYTYRGYCSHYVCKKIIKTAANLTSTLLVEYVADKLETILDRETKITHEQFASQIEARLGYGEGDNAKGPDMKIWSLNKALNDVRLDPSPSKSSAHDYSGRLDIYRVRLHTHHTFPIH